MTVKQTALNIKSRMESLTEVVGQDGETGEDITKPVFDNVVIGNYNPENMPNGTLLSIRAVLEDETLDFAGPSPPNSPFSVPWHITLYVSGPISKATLRVYELVPIIWGSLLTDLTFNGACSEGFMDKPRVVYDEDMQTSNRMVSGARFKLRTNHF